MESLMTDATFGSITRGCVFGFDLAASDLQTVSEAIARAALHGEQGHICVANVDLLTRARANSEFGALVRCARLVVPDGQPLVWLLRLAGFRSAKRLYGPDLTLALCQQAALLEVPVFLYGGTDAESRRLKEKLNGAVPGLRIAGSLSPGQLPIRPHADPQHCQQINASGAKIVLVGLGCPKQEYWMWAQRDQLAALSVGVGLAFAQLAGLVPRAPRWMQRAGLEWLYRLIREPKRLWRRYAVGNSRYLYYLFVDLCAGRVRASKLSNKN